MRRAFEYGTKVRPKLLWRATRSYKHGVKNTGSSIFSGSKEAMNSQGLRRLGVRNVAQRTKCAIFCVFFLRHLLLPYYPRCLQERIARQRS